MDLLASAMPNEFTPATTTRMKKTTGMNAGPDPKQQREDHTRETHVRQRAPGHYTPGPRPLLAGTQGDTRLETRVPENACIHYTCDACIHRTCDAGLHWTCDADLHTHTCVSRDKAEPKRMYVQSETSSAVIGPRWPMGTIYTFIDPRL